MTDSLYEKASAAAELIQSRTALRPRIGIVLGSGLGAFAGQLQDAGGTQIEILGAEGGLIIGSEPIGHA